MGGSCERYCVGVGFALVIRGRPLKPVQVLPESRNELRQINGRHAEVAWRCFADIDGALLVPDIVGKSFLPNIWPPVPQREKARHFLRGRQ